MSLFSPLLNGNSVFCHKGERKPENIALKLRAFLLTVNQFNCLNQLIDY